MVNMVGLAVISVLSLACVIAALVKIKTKPKFLFVGLLGIFISIPSVVLLAVAVSNWLGIG